MNLARPFKAGLGATNRISSRSDGWCSVVADATKHDVGDRIRGLKATAKLMPTLRVADPPFAVLIEIKPRGWVLQAHTPHPIPYSLCM